MATIKDIAERAGVSTATVSNVIKGKRNKVSKETIEKIEKIITELNYVPSMGARILSEKRSKIIGVICTFMNVKDNSLKDPFTAELLGVIENEIRKNGYYMMLYASNKPEEIKNLVSTWSVDGLIFAGINEKTYNNLRKISKKPVVVIDGYYKNDDFYNVGTNDEEGGYIITKYLIDKGHKNIIFVDETNKKGNPIKTVDGERLKGFKRALKEIGIKYTTNNHVYIDPLNKEKFFDEIKNKNSTAVVCSSDNIAFEVINGLKKRNICVPENISVTGFDDVYLSSLSSPTLTTINQNINEKGEKAVRMLINIIEEKHIENKNIHISVSIKERDSVKKI